MRINSIIALSADILSIAALWAGKYIENTPVKVVLTAFAIGLACAIIFLWNRSGKAKISDYYIDNDLPVLYIKRNKIFTHDMLVSIYEKRSISKPVAIGYTIDCDNQNLLQVTIYSVCSSSTLSQIGKEKNQYKNYVIRPVIRHSELELMNLRLVEGK